MIPDEKAEDEVRAIENMDQQENTNAAGLIQQMSEDGLDGTRGLRAWRWIFVCTTSYISRNLKKSR